MLLFFLLGVIANVALFCDGCSVGPRDVINFDWIKFTGEWYLKSHYDNYIEDEYDCTNGTFALPLLDTSSVVFIGYSYSTGTRLENPGDAYNWNSAGYFDLQILAEIWTGRYYVISIDYESYVILQLCHTLPLPVSVYVWYRRQNPDATTVQLVKTKLQEYNLNGKQLVDWPNENCQ